MHALEAVVSVLRSIGALFALIGGRAVGARGYPRMTLDYDLLTSEASVLDPALWSQLSEGGVSVDSRKGEVR